MKHFFGKPEARHIGGEVHIQRVVQYKFVHRHEVEKSSSDSLAVHLLQLAGVIFN